VEFRAGRRASIAAVTVSPIARNRTDLSRGVHLADALVVDVRDIDIPGTIHRHAKGLAESRAGRRASIADGTLSPRARHRTDLSRAHSHLTDAVVAFVSDIDIPGTIHRHAIGLAEFRAGRRASIAAVTVTPIARRRTDRSRG